MKESQLPTECVFTLALVRAFVTGESTPPPLPDECNWDVFLTVIARHPRALMALLPLIMQSDVPWEVKTQLAASVKPLRDHTRLVMERFTRVVAALQQANLDFIVLKGPVLAATCYSQPESRFITDIDLLVEPEVLQKTRDLMNQLGFERPELVRSEQFYREQHFHYIFADSAGIQVEVHWQLTEPGDYAQFDLNHVRSDARSVSIAHGETSLAVQAFCSEDNLLHVVSQAMPGFTSLGRLMDACLLLRESKEGGGTTHDRLSLEALCDKAKSYGLGASLWLMLELANEVARVDCRPLRSHVRPTGLRRFCLSSLPIARRLITEPASQTGLSHLIYLLGCPSPKHATEYIRRIAWPREKQLHQLGLEPRHVSTVQLWRLRSVGVGSLAKMSGYLVWRTFRHLIFRCFGSSLT